MAVEGKKGVFVEMRMFAVDPDISRKGCANRLRTKLMVRKSAPVCVSVRQREKLQCAVSRIDRFVAC